MARYDFASDNTAGAAPEAMQSLTAANEGFASGYGTDHVTARAADLVRELLDADADVRFLANGTAANSIALAALARPFEAVLAHHHAHVITDETGAPGFFGSGVGLVPLPGGSGKIDPEALRGMLDTADVSHRQSFAALSLTNATEYGTVYTDDELRRLIEAADTRDLPVHLDGARLANAAAAGFEVKELPRIGVDVLVIGGTKAGMPPTEALVLFDKSLSRRFDARLKQAGQLTSKGRFLAAPWIGMLETNAWTDRAVHANAMASKLAGLIAERTPFRLAHPVQANAVFVHMDEPALQRLRAEGWFVYRFLDGSVRFMCSWATTAEAVEEIGDALTRII
ncbi:MAG TPA: low specificity L-threonine aldolase [Caulobacteraceae bacterium]|jgi:threonine aldolase